MNEPEHRLAALSEDMFRRVVEADARNKATESESAALRHRLNCGRWMGALQLMTRDIRAQIEARKGSGDTEWEGRAIAKLRRVRARAMEAQAIIVERKDQDRAERAAALKAGTTLNQRREAAYLAAQKQLSARHIDEFYAILVDTHAREGVSLPDNIARSIARRKGAAERGLVDG